jgi:hypothetical protein
MFRVAYRLTVERFAEKLGVAARTVAKWDSRPDLVPTPALQEALDTALEQAPHQVRSRLSLLLADLRRDDPTGAGRCADGGARDMGAMQAFRIADLRVGGGHLYPAVMGYLREEVAPRLVDPDRVAEDRGVFTAAAAITEMAAWMAHDAGQDSLAHRHFSRALELAHVGGDRRVRAHVFASMSHLEDHLHRPAAAISSARAGRDALVGGLRNPDLDARLYAMEARAHAALHEPAECIRMLTGAEMALTSSRDEEPSQWVGSFDEGSLASEAARCMRELGDLGEAERQAARVVALRPPSRMRSRAFGQLLLAEALARQGRLEEACAMAEEVLELTRGLRSHLVVHQLRRLAKVLARAGPAGPLGDFAFRVDAELQQRSWRSREVPDGDAELIGRSGGPA